MDGDINKKVKTTLSFVCVTTALKGQWAHVTPSLLNKNIKFLFNKRQLACSQTLEGIYCSNHLLEHPTYFPKAGSYKYDYSTSLLPKGNCDRVA